MLLLIATTVLTGCALAPAGEAGVGTPPPDRPAALAGSAMEAAIAPPVPGEVLRARRAALRRSMGRGIAIVEARGGPEGDPVTRSFLHLTGVETPGAILLLAATDDDAEGDGEEILFLPPRDRGWERWHGPRLAPGEEARHRTGVNRTEPLAAFDATLTRLVSREGMRGAPIWHLSIPASERALPP
ncbi:MAG: aminopeptidase P N-terminal domain-containing protein, partial [Planctomycetota bacterium]